MALTISTQFLIHQLLKHEETRVSIPRTMRNSQRLTSTLTLQLRHSSSNTQGQAQQVVSRPPQMRIGTGYSPGWTTASNSRPLLAQHLREQILVQQRGLEKGAEILELVWA